MRELQKKYILGCLYHHPNCDIVDFQLALESTVSLLSNQKIPCIFTGYINIDLFKWSSQRPTAGYLDSLLSNISFHAYL